MKTNRKLTPEQRYERAIDVLTRRIMRLRRRNPRPDIRSKAEISLLTTRRDELAGNLEKLRQSATAAAQYQEMITTHNKDGYALSLAVAQRMIGHYEGLAPSDTELGALNE